MLLCFKLAQEDLHLKSYAPLQARSGWRALLLFKGS